MYEHIIFNVRAITTLETIHTYFLIIYRHLADGEKIGVMSIYCKQLTANNLSQLQLPHDNWSQT